MIEYRFAVSDDMDELLDLINLIFSQTGKPHDFETLLPKVYRSKNRLADIHAIALENGRICGCAGVYPFCMRLGDSVLKAGYVGSVAVHPRMRKRGIMKTLMNMCIERAQDENLDLLMLSGQRQRYEYYGFTPGGTLCRYTMDEDNVRHAYRNVDASGYTFRPAEEADSARMAELYERKAAVCLRPEERFLDTLRSFDNTPWAVLKEDRLTGYLTADVCGGVIGELVLEKDAMIPAVLKAWTVQKNGCIQILAGPYDDALHEVLSPVCESFSVEPSCSVRCLNMRHVLEACMQYAHTHTALNEGERCMRIKEQGTFLLRVSDGKLNINQIDEPAELELTVLEAQRLFFCANPFSISGLRSQMPRGWFPLPFGIAQPDTF